ncbi:Crossover junction endonuclease MUS81 [Nymphon striatum]|nr:Crossover junction endonuclease MUS81 [Nymphon striatum]
MLAPTRRKFRLGNCGLTRPIYLVENYGKSNYGIPESSLYQAITNTQIVNGFTIRHVKDSKESVAYLTMITRHLISDYEMIPDHPWETVGSDIFTIKERSYLVTVDYYSGFFEIDFLLDTLSKTVITKLKHHFARHGIPIKFISDGGPQYTSELFKAFEIKWNFNHEYSSPVNSKANGAAEAAVKQAKRLLKKCVHSNEDPYIGLLNIRNTPTESLNSSPAQRLFCRRTRTMLPIVSSLLISDPMSKSEFKLKKEMRRNDIAVRENQTRHDLKPLLPGDKVVIEPYKRGDSHWHPATVHKAIKPRTYEITTNDGRQIRRNRQQLRNKPNLDMPQSSPTISPKSSSNKPEHVLDSPTCSPPILLDEPLNETSSNGSPDPYQTKFGRQIKPIIAYVALSNQIDSTEGFVTHMNVSGMFIKFLMKVGGMSPEKATAIVNRYPTVSHLLEAYSNCQSDKEKESLLAKIKSGKNNRNIGPALSRVVFQLFCSMESF